MKQLLTILIFSITISSFSQTNTMKWYDLDFETLLDKAKQEDKIAFLYIYEDSEVCEVAYEEAFTKSSVGFEQAYDVVDLHNKHFISGKYTIDEVSILKKDVTIPAFIWINSDGKLIESRVGSEVNVRYFSEKLFEELNSDIINFNENLKSKDCEDLFCAYNELRRVFLNTPDSRKEYELYQLVKQFSGGLNSVELKWLINYSEFEEEDHEDKMGILWEALLFSYMKETGDYEMNEAFNSYANDKLIKPLGEYAAPFKKYLIAEDEGKGFALLESKTQTIYYNANWELCDKANAEYYRIAEQDIDGKLKGGVKDYYITGELQYEGSFSYADKYDNTKDIKEGKTVWYYKNGKTQQEGFYKNNTLNGKFTKYFKSGNKLSEEYYENDKSNGKYSSWYQNGELYAQGEYLNDQMNGEWEYYYENNGVLSEYKNYENGQLTTSTIDHNIIVYYDEDGRVSYIPYSEDYGFDYDVLGDKTWKELTEIFHKSYHSDNKRFIVSWSTVMHEIPVNNKYDNLLTFISLNQLKNVTITESGVKLYLNENIEQRKMLGSNVLETNSIGTNYLIKEPNLEIRVSIYFTFNRFLDILKEERK